MIHLALLAKSSGPLQQNKCRLKVFLAKESVSLLNFNACIYADEQLYTCPVSVREKYDAVMNRLKKNVTVAFPTNLNNKSKRLLRCIVVLLVVGVYQNKGAQIQLHLLLCLKHSGWHVVVVVVGSPSPYCRPSSVPPYTIQ